MADSRWATSTRCCIGLRRVRTGPAFRDISLGGNAVDISQPGYDVVTGLGSPNVDYLVRDLLDIQKGVAPR